MASDPKDGGRKTPPGGIPRAATERPTPRPFALERDRFVPKHGVPTELEPELTPVTRIEAVRTELHGVIDALRDNMNDDINSLRTDLHSLDGRVSETNSAVSRLAGAVETSNNQMPLVLEIIKNELAAKRDTEHLIVTTKTDVERARAISEIDTQRDDKKDQIQARKDKRKVWLLPLTLVTSTGIVTTIITLVIAPLIAKC